MERRVSLGESQAPYSLAVEEEMLGQEPFVLERNGKAIAAVVPMAEYLAFRAWREQRDPPGIRDRNLDEFYRERDAFERLKPKLLRTHLGQWVAVYRQELVAAGHEQSQVLENVYARFGYVPVYVQHVQVTPPLYRLPRRRIVP